MKRLVCLIVLLTSVSCSTLNTSGRKPASIILDQEFLRDSRNELIAQMASDNSDTFPIKMDRVSKVVDSIKYDTQLEVLKLAFDRKYYNPEVLEELMSITSSSTFDIFHDHIDLFLVEDTRFAKDLIKVLLVGDESPDALLFRTEYFAALVDNKTDKARSIFDITKKMKNIKGSKRNEMFLILADLLSDVRYEVNEVLWDEFIEISSKVESLEQLKYLIRLLDSEFSSIADVNLLKRFELIKSDEIGKMTLLYLRVAASRDEKPSTEVLHLFNKMEARKLSVMTESFEEYLSGAVYSTEGWSDPETTISYSEFNRSFINVLKRVNDIEHNSFMIEALSFYLKESVFFGDAPDKNFLELIYKVRSREQVEFIEKLSRRLEGSRQIGKLSTKQLESYSELLGKIDSSSDLSFAILAIEDIESKKFQLEDFDTSEEYNSAYKKKIIELGKEFGLVEKDFVDFDEDMDYIKFFKELREIGTADDSIKLHPKYIAINKLMLAEFDATTQRQAAAISMSLKAISKIDESLFDSNFKCSKRKALEIAKLMWENPYFIGNEVERERFLYHVYVSNLSMDDIKYYSNNFEEMANGYFYQNRSPNPRIIWTNLENGIRSANGNRLADEVDGKSTMWHLFNPGSEVFSQSAAITFSAEEIAYLEEREYLLHAEISEYNGKTYLGNRKAVIRSLMSLSDDRRVAVEALAQIGGDLSKVMYFMKEDPAMTDEIARGFHDAKDLILYLDKITHNGDIWKIDYLQATRRKFHQEYKRPMRFEHFQTLLLETLDVYKKEKIKREYRRRNQEFANRYGPMDRDLLPNPKSIKERIYRALKDCRTLIYSFIW